MGEGDRGRDDGDAAATHEDALMLAETVLTDAVGGRSATHAAPDRHPSSTLKSRADPALDATVAASDAAPAVKDTDRRAPLPFGPYSKVEVLAEQGSIGLVARGYNDGFGRWELIKFLREELASDPEIVRQFKREGRVLAQLSHPNVVQVFATWEVEGRTCLAMEFLEGQPLSAYIAAQGGRLPAARALGLLLEAARGLAASHEVGLLHRDLKPDNLFVTAAGKGRAGGLKLIDFGLATAERGRPSMVNDPSLVSGTAGGTPLYMAPELWRGREATAQSDLYALGLTFWFSLAGRLPIKSETLGAIRTELLDPAPLASLRDARPDVPPALAAIVDRLIQKDAARRFASADELVSALAAAESDSRARAVPSSGPYRGLDPFTAAERDVFFGREREIVEILERLRREPALVLVGPAASGKSSLALAGVAPAIADGGLGGDLAFSVATIEPRVEALRAVPPEGARVIVVDGLDQLAAAADAGAALAFATALGALIEHAAGDIKVIATLRAEQMDRLFALEPLRGLLERGFYPVRPLPAAELRRVVEAPAHAAGYAFEDPSAPDTVVSEVAGSPAALPLVSFAMRAWWQKRDERRKLLTAAAWAALGGVSGALVAHAESVILSMAAEERDAAERILPRLVSAHGVRTRLPRLMLSDPALSGSAGERALARLLADKVLVASGTDVELAHDALAGRWPRLAGLLREPGTDRAFREHVAAAARDWHAGGRPDGMLWGGAQAARLEEWFAGTEAALGQTELAFVEAVRHRARLRRFALRSLAAAGVLLAVVIVFITQARARRISMQLDKTNADLAAARAGAAAELRTLLLQVAELEVDDAPEKALEAAQHSRELGPDPALDVVAWRASLAGLPVIVPAHRDGAALLAFTPSGDRFVTATRGGGLRSYAVANERTESVALPGQARLTAVALSPDGESAAIGDAAGDVALVAGGTARPSSPGKGAVRWLAWTKGGVVVARHDIRMGGDLLLDDAADSALSGDGTRLAALTRDADLVVVDVASRHEIARAAAPGANVLGVSQDGTLMLLGDAAGRLALVAPGKKPQWRSTPLAAIASIAASPDGQRWLTVDTGGRASLWSATLERIATLRAKPGAAYAWFDHGAALAITGHDQEVRLVAAASGLALGRIAAGPHGVDQLAATDDWVVASSADGAVRAWSLAVTAARPVPATGACRLAADAAALGCVRGDRFVVEKPPGSRGKDVAAPPAAPLLFAASGDRLATVDAQGRLSRFDGGAWTSDDLSVHPTALALSPESVAVIGDKRLLVGARHARPHPVALSSGGATAVAFTPEDARLIVGTTAGVIEYPDTSKRLPVFPGHAIRGLAPAPDGSGVAAADDAGHVAVIASGKVHTVWRAGAPVTTLAWSRSARGLVAGTRAGGVWLVDTETGRAVLLLAARDPVERCARGDTSDRFWCTTADGSLFDRTLDLDPVWMKTKPDNDLDRAADISSWKGLERDTP